MKKIHLIRHAKSNWEDSSLKDIERPLSQRGIKACQLMAKEILNAPCNFQNVFSSTAVRAQSTIENISKNIPNQKITWHLDENLYTFNSQDLLIWCQTISDSLQEIVLIGHNPAMTDFCNYLSNSNIYMPTCAYAQLKYNKNSWKDLTDSSASLVKILRPKDLLQ